MPNLAHVYMVRALADRVASRYWHAKIGAPASRIDPDKLDSPSYVTLGIKTRHERLVPRLFEELEAALSPIGQMHNSTLIWRYESRILVRYGSLYELEGRFIDERGFVSLRTRVVGLRPMGEIAYSLTVPEGSAPLFIEDINPSILNASR